MNEEQIKALCEARGVKVGARFDWNKIIEIIPYIVAILEIFGVLQDEDDQRVGE